MVRFALSASLRRTSSGVFPGGSFRRHNESSSGEFRRQVVRRKYGAGGVVAQQHNVGGGRKMKGEEGVDLMLRPRGLTQ